MGTALLKSLVILFIVTSISTIYANDCPSKCTCKRSNQADTAEWIKVRCGEVEKVQSLDELDLNNIASEIVQLNLSSNLLTAFTPKVQFVALQKLDIGNNQIAALLDRQFIEVPNLRRLDISGNVIKTIGKYAFEDLKHLERLKLSQNQINTIEKGTFDDLENLKQIDISNNPLTCDCELLWLLKWVEDKSVKLMSNPKCLSPPAFKGVSIKKVKIGVHVHCKSPAGSREMPIVEITPSYSQVVFEGDSLKLNCRAPSISDGYDALSKDHIEWFFVDSDPKVHFEDVVVENRYLEDSGLVDSSLIINQITSNHSGPWNCQLISSKQNQSKGITIIVISKNTKYCHSTTTTNNKGTYIWPKTIVNNTVSLPCESLQHTNDIQQQKATYFCNPLGKWESINTTRCSYISDTTKILEQFSKVNLSLVKGTIIDSAKHFKNYISDLSLLKDVDDLVYVVRTIQNYLQFVSTEKELGSILIDVTSAILTLNATYISKACVEDNSCTKLINAVETIAGYTSSPNLHKPNVALEIFTVKQATFSGMTCTWYATRTNRQERILYCVTTNQVPRSSAREKSIEASIQIPASFFHNLRQRDLLLDMASHQILISMFADGQLFPTKTEGQVLTSGVVGVKLDNFIIRNISEPINIMLRSPDFYESSEIVPVWWDPTYSNGTGGWSRKGCRYKEEIDDCIVFSCDQLGYYSLQRNATQVKNCTKFKFSHPAIYIGSLILFMCLLTSIVSYIMSYGAIQMPKKAKHSLINIWISIALLCFMYVFGIYQTEDLRLCQAIGLILHYLTLSSLLWMCVGVNGMYKRLQRNDRLELQDDELPSDMPIQKPIIGLYFVGWGVALIVCGISGAVNIKEYASNSFCFLRDEPALSALYVPFAMLFIMLLISFCLIRCAMYSVDAGGHLSEGTQATENVDLDLLEPSFTNMDVRSVPSISTKTGSSEIEDPEHSPAIQLKAYMIFLFIFVLTWFSCAFATVQPEPLKSYDEVFCIMFAVLSIVLGSFTVFFYCIARNDVRTQWILLSKSFRRRNVCFRSRNVSDTIHNVPQIQIQPLPPIPTDDIHIASRSSSTSSHTKSNNSHAYKGADLNSSNYSDPRGKVNNVNLVVLHRQQYRNAAVIVPNLIENPTSTAEMFYNPHQSTVARKFFRKQKQKMLKNNNLAKRELNDNSSVASFPKLKDNSSVDQSIFGTNSKVNNTNIHVEKIRKTKNRNPNMLLDSCEDVDQIKPGDNLREYKDRRRRTENKQRQKKKQNVNVRTPINDNMRTVSQQCTLEYSSEPISDSILDQRSPEKCLMIPENFSKTETVGISIQDNKKRNGVDQVNEMLHTLYEPSECSSTSEFVKAPPLIYVNPSHDILFTKRVQSRASSVSASEIDEIYQQIRRGGGPKSKSSYRYKNDEFRPRQPSPCYSDSEINSTSDVRHRRIINFFDDHGSDKVESTV